MRLLNGVSVVVIATLLGVLAAGVADAKPVDKASIEKIVKSEVAEQIAGINAHDAEKATRWEADNIVSMEAGRPPSSSLKDDREGIGMAMKMSPSWRLRMIDETVDVASAGDMAVYRSTYWQDSDDDNHVAMTQKVNFVAGFKKQTDGAWKMTWSVVAAQERPHKK
jgi:ketosteroid isomerase-like protein